MSLDLYLTCDHCGSTVAEFNYTWNVAPMWYAVSPQDENMVPIEGMTGKESLLKLEPAFAVMKSRAEELIKLQPPNGWGSFEGFLRFIDDLIAAAKQNPELKWRASR